jgi:hypothetical protein
MEDKQPQSIVKFLLGESDFENKWYGVRENGIAPYWWRTELRKEVESFTYQLSSALESYNRECKRNGELQEEVDRLKQWKKEEIELWWPIIELMRLDTTIPLGTSLSDEALKRLKEFKSQKEEIELYREALTQVVNAQTNANTIESTYQAFEFLQTSLNDIIISALSKHQPIKKDEN